MEVKPKIIPFTKEEQLKFIKKAKKEKDNLEQENRDLWRHIIYLKANFKCEYPGCGFNWGKLDAHHYFSKGAYSHMRFDLQNGICLCAKHHAAGFSREAAHSDPHFREKILGLVKGYKAIRTEEWDKILSIRAQQKSFKVDLKLENIYLKNELERFKDKIEIFRDKIDPKFLKKHNL